MAEPEPERSFDLAEAIEELARRSETSYAVVMGSHVEDWLKDAIQSKMRNLSKTVEERLFRGYGPLSSALSKD
jgi:hypothetical protein